MKRIESQKEWLERPKLGWENQVQKNYISLTGIVELAQDSFFVHL